MFDKNFSLDIADIDSTKNLISLQHDVHYAFDRFKWCCNEYDGNQVSVLFFTVDNNEAHSS
jgi:hypothetical protein